MPRLSSSKGLAARSFKPLQTSGSKPSRRAKQKSSKNSYNGPQAVLVVMAGLQGAGKSSAIQRLLNTPRLAGALVLESDAIREMLSPLESAPKWRPSSERHVHGVIDNFVRGCLLHGRSVIVDSTNLTVKKRAHWIRIAEQLKARVECVLVDVSVETSIARSSRWIPAAGIRKHFKTFERPSIDEGFDCVVVIKGE